MIRVTFLGTAASRPTVGRNVSAIAIQHAGDLLLFDCGEGTQRQMMRFASGFNVSDIFFTHLHGDHFLGVIGLLRTMALQGRDAGIRLWGPRGSAQILDAAVNLGIERVAFPVEIGELVPGQTLRRDDYDIVAYRAQHGPTALGFALIEHERLGRFHPDRARDLGVPEGPAFGRLHRGEPVEVDGRTIRPEDVVGPARRGRRVVYSGDTRPSAETAAIADQADLLIHDATFGDEEADRARATGHSTAREAARLAQRCGAARLVLTHLSARYADDPRTLEGQAREVFPGALVAWDGLQIEVPLPEDDG